MRTPDEISQKNAKHLVGKTVQPKCILLAGGADGKPGASLNESCQTEGLEPEKVVFLFPSNDDHHKFSTGATLSEKLSTLKSGGGLAIPAGDWGVQGNPVLGLPSTFYDAKSNKDAVATSAVRDMWEAVGAGYSFILPVRKVTEEDTIEKGITKEANRKYFKPKYDFSIDKISHQISWFSGVQSWNEKDHEAMGNRYAMHVRIMFAFMEYRTTLGNDLQNKTTEQLFSGFLTDLKKTAPNLRNDEVFAEDLTLVKNAYEAGLKQAFPKETQSVVNQAEEKANVKFPEQKKSTSIPKPPEEKSTHTQPKPLPQTTTEQLEREKSNPNLKSQPKKVVREELGIEVDQLIFAAGRKAEDSNYTTGRWTTDNARVTGRYPRLLVADQSPVTSSMALTSNNGVTDMERKALAREMQKKVVKYIINTIHNGKTLPDKLYVAVPVNVGAHWVSVGATISFKNSVDAKFITDHACVKEESYESGSTEKIRGALHFKDEKEKEQFEKECLERYCAKFDLKVADSLSEVNGQANAFLLSESFKEPFGSIPFTVKNSLVQSQQDLVSCGVFAAKNTLKYLEDKGEFPKYIATEEEIDAAYELLHEKNKTDAVKSGLDVSTKDLKSSPTDSTSKQSTPTTSTSSEPSEGHEQEIKLSFSNTKAHEIVQKDKNFTIEKQDDNWVTYLDSKSGGKFLMNKAITPEEEKSLIIKYQTPSVENSQAMQAGVVDLLKEKKDSLLFSIQADKYPEESDAQLQSRLSEAYNSLIGAGVKDADIIFTQGEKEVKIPGVRLEEKKVSPSPPKKYSIFGEGHKNELEENIELHIRPHH
jgi:hypothetical protein